MQDFLHRRDLLHHSHMRNEDLDNHLLLENLLRAVGAESMPCSLRRHHCFRYSIHVPRCVCQPTDQLQLDVLGWSSRRNGKQNRRTRHLDTRCLRQRTAFTPVSGANIHKKARQFVTHHLSLQRHQYWTGPDPHSSSHHTVVSIAIRVRHVL